MNGIINIFKPKNMTSHDVVSFLRKKLNMKRVGHTGTLDPMVTGVLPICIGNATRISEYLLELDKTYVGELTLGYSTESQDSYAPIVNKSNRNVTKREIQEVFDSYKGHIKQVPPMYSAVKYKGKKLYELARKGISIQRKARDVKIYDLEILKIMDNRKIIFYCRCSKGTYVRSLCNDIGEDLKTYAYMSSLIRTQVGDFKINKSYSLDFLASLTKMEIWDLLIPMEDSLNHFKEITLPDHNYKKLINGVPIVLGENEFYDIGKNESLRVFCNKTFIGIGNIMSNSNKVLRMKKVLTKVN